MIFQKSLKISSQAMAGDSEASTDDTHGWSNGRIVSLMSVDTSRIEQMCGTLHMLWTAPISILLSLVLLYVNISYSGAYTPHDPKTVSSVNTSSLAPNVFGSKQLLTRYPFSTRWLLPPRGIHPPLGSGYDNTSCAAFGDQQTY